MAISPPDPSLDFETWARRLQSEPLTTDLRGLGLLLVVVTITVVVGTYGLVLFPPVPLPRVVLAVPGLVGGGLAFFGLRKIYFRMTPALTMPLSLILAAGGGLALLAFFDVFPSP